MAFLMFSIFHELDVKDVQIFKLLEFIEVLVQRGLAVATIKNYISSLKSKLNTLGIKTIAFNSPRLSIVITALENNKKSVFKPKPVLFNALLAQAEWLHLFGLRFYLHIWRFSEY
jgi:hypothetical protein